MGRLIEKSLPTQYHNNKKTQRYSCVSSGIRTHISVRVKQVRAVTVAGLSLTYATGCSSTPEIFQYLEK